MNFVAHKSLTIKPKIGIPPIHLMKFSIWRTNLILKIGPTIIEYEMMMNVNASRCCDALNIIQLYTSIDDVDNDGQRKHIEFIDKQHYIKFKLKLFTKWIYLNKCFY